MLIILRSDFRVPDRKAFFDLMIQANVKIDPCFEVPVLQAPAPNAIILRLRKMQPEQVATLIMGSSKNETLEESLQVLKSVRQSMPFLNIYPTILLARKSEWRQYKKVLDSENAIEYFEEPESSALVLVQSDQYSEKTRQVILIYTQPIKALKSSKRQRESETQEFIIGDRPTGSMARITDEMLREAGIEGSIEPDPEDRITTIPPPVSLDPAKAF